MCCFVYEGHGIVHRVVLSVCSKPVFFLVGYRALGVRKGRRKNPRVYRGMRVEGFTVAPFEFTGKIENILARENCIHIIKSKRYKPPLSSSWLRARCYFLGGLLAFLQV